MLRKRDKRRLVKEKQRQRNRTPEEQAGLNKILADLKALREKAIEQVAPVQP